MYQLKHVRFLRLAAIPRDCSKLSRGSQNDFFQIENTIDTNILTNLIPEPELFFAELHASTETLCNAEAFIVEFACELEANSTEPRTARCVNTDARSQLTDNRPKLAGLDTTAGNEGARIASVRDPYYLILYLLAMHWIAHPCDRVSGAFHGFNMASQVVPYLDGYLVNG